MKKYPDTFVVELNNVAFGNTVFKQLYQSRYKRSKDLLFRNKKYALLMSSQCLDYTNQVNQDVQETSLRCQRRFNVAKIQDTN